MFPVCQMCYIEEKCALIEQVICSVIHFTCLFHHLDLCQIFINHVTFMIIRGASDHVTNKNLVELFEMTLSMNDHLASYKGQMLTVR